MFGLFPFQFPEASEPSFRKPSATGSHTGASNGPISTRKVKKC